MKWFLDWATGQVTDSVKWRRLNGWLVIVWTVAFPVAIVTGAIYVLAFTAMLSVYANWATHLGVWAASRAEAMQDEDRNDMTEMGHTTTSDTGNGW